MFRNIFVNKLVIALSLKLKSFMEMDPSFFKSITIGRRDSLKSGDKKGNSFFWYFLSMISCKEFEIIFVAFLKINKL